MACGRGNRGPWLRYLTTPSGRWSQVFLRQNASLNGGARRTTSSFTFPGGHRSGDALHGSGKVPGQGDQSGMPVRLDGKSSRRSWGVDSPPPSSPPIPPFALLIEE